MNAANLIGGLIFGSIGFVAFLYGKKEAHLKSMLLGITLMVYPYLISNGVALFAVGAILTVALFLFRD